jgi:hypothetical protein
MTPGPGPVTARDLWQHVRTGGRAVQIRFAVLAAAFCIFAGVCVGAVTAVILAAVS